MKCVGLDKVPEDDWYCDKCQKIAAKVKSKKNKDGENNDEDDEDEEDDSETSCTICGVGGSLICCDKCPKCYHLKCVNLTVLYILLSILYRMFLKVNGFVLDVIAINV